MVIIFYNSSITVPSRDTSQSLTTPSFNVRISTALTMNTQLTHLGSHMSKKICDKKFRVTDWRIKTPQITTFKKMRFEYISKLKPLIVVKSSNAYWLKHSIGRTKKKNNLNNVNAHSIVNSFIYKMSYVSFSYTVKRR